MGTETHPTTAEVRAKTNDKPNSTFDVTGHLMPARAFFFIVVEEVGKEGFLVRKTYAALNNTYLKGLGLDPQMALATVYPERFGLFPYDAKSNASVAEHVLGHSKQTSYLSASSKFPEGSPRFEGKKIYIDINKAKQSGATLVTTEEILASLEQYKKANPNNPRVIKDVERISRYVRDIDKEVLVKPTETGVPAKAIYTPESLSTAKNITRGARAVQAFGIVLTAYDLGGAANESIRINSVKPITAETIRQAGGWGGAMAGFKIGAVGGAFVGIKTGPGAIITGLIGGIIFGAAGYCGADWVADHIYEN